MNNDYTIGNGSTITAVVLGIFSCLFASLSFIILMKMKVTDCVTNLRMSSIIMLLNLVASDGLRCFFNLTGMIRYLIVYHLSSDKPICGSSCYCKVQSFLSIWFNMIVFICILFIGIFAIYQIFGDSSEIRKVTYKTLITTSIFAWSIPFLLTLIPAFSNALGEDQTKATNGWCWITSCNKTISEKTRITFMILYSRGLEALIFLINITLFIVLKYIDYNHMKLQENIFVFGISVSTQSDGGTPEVINEATNDSKLLFLINISICFCRLWGMIRTTLEIIFIANKSENSNYFKTAEDVLIVFQGIFENIQSIGVFIVLILCSKFANFYFRRLFCRIKTNGDEN